MSRLFNKVKSVLSRYPVLRGMATYSLLWPSSNFLQQYTDKTRKEIDYLEMLRYFVLGTFATAPTVYAWFKTASFLIPGNGFKRALAKAALDVIIFAPIGQTQFYLGITLLEGRPWEECIQEWNKKLLPTWKVAICFWPVVQTLNFTYVPEKNRVIVVSLASFLWTIFLSYMHHSTKDTLPGFMIKKHDTPPPLYEK